MIRTENRNGFASKTSDLKNFAVGRAKNKATIPRINKANDHATPIANTPCPPRTAKATRNQDLYRQPRALLPLTQPHLNSPEPSFSPFHLIPREISRMTARQGL